MKETGSKSTKFSPVRVARAVLAVVCIVLAVLLVPLVGSWLPWRLVSSSSPVALANGATFVVKKIKGPVETELKLVFFDSSRCDLRVVGQVERERAVTVERMAESSEALAVCNGGYFDTRSFLPSGLQVTEGIREGELIREPLWGCVYVRSGDLKLLSVDRFKEEAGITDFLQCSPMLIENERALRLEGATRNRRTFIMTDGAGHWAFGTCRNIGLQELASAIGTRGIICEMAVKEAMNLDGGPSTSLCCRSGAKTVFYDKEAWPVKNMLVLKPKK